jgi:hypothetical protein
MDTLHLGRSFKRPPAWVGCGEPVNRINLDRTDAVRKLTASYICFTI